jgi:hypothetical protein
MKNLGEDLNFVNGRSRTGLLALELKDAASA